MHLQKKNIGVDEELGKKDDDHRKGRSAMTSPATSTFPWRGPRRKRFLLAFIAALGIYVFIKNLPQDGAVASHRQQPFKPTPPSDTSPLWEDAAPKGAPPRPENPEKEQYYYEGPISYYNLAASFGLGFGHAWGNRNVLFAVSSLKSAASLLPLACDMSKQKRNKVHIMLTGRDPLPVEEILKVNRISDDDCSVMWHDGRPDYSQYSTERRMEHSVRASFKHLEADLKPRIVLVDSAEREDAFFSRAIQSKTAELGVRLIELPLNAAENLQWISKLDSHSLRAWNDVGIEILIHAPSESSGSLIRLLKSLEKADYFGFSPPRITIELPPSVDPPTLSHLSNFRWPPNSAPGDSKLTIRHRLATDSDSAQSALRQIESFYPPNPNFNLLVLSSQVELSRLYFQYLIYTLLEYRCAATAYHTTDLLVGIALERPQSTLDNQSPLQPPKTENPSNLFLYQAPSANAALYFGDKWADLHAFASRRLAASTTTPTKTPNTEISYPLPSDSPPWLQYLLELSRLRAYTMLYPGSSNPDDALAAVHPPAHPLPPPPPPPSTPSPPPSSASTSPTTPPTSKSPPPILHAPLLPSPPVPPATLLSRHRSILHLLSPSLPPTTPASDSGPGLPDLYSLPFLSYRGEGLEKGRVDLVRGAVGFRGEFRRGVGGCKEGKGEGEKGGEEEGTLEGGEGWLDGLFCESRGEVEAGKGG